MKIEKGRIILSEKDYKKIRKEIINGKIKYIIDTNVSNDPKIEKEEFEELILKGYSLPKLLIFYSTTDHYVNKFMYKTYNTKSIKKIFKSLTVKKEGN